MEYRVGSLFAGVGGICLGFKNASNEKNSFRLVFANELDSFACITYRNNFHHTLYEGDIEKILNPEDGDDSYQQINESMLNEKIDILTAGFPCQPFSQAGMQKGFEDSRGNLFFSIMKLIKEYEKRESKPSILFLENVKNLKSHDHGNTYKVIKGTLESMGYHIFDTVMNTMNYSDLPQNRERIYILAFLDKEKRDAYEKAFQDKVAVKYHSYDKEKWHSLTKEILDYDSDVRTLKKYYYTKEVYPHYFLSEEEYEKTSPRKPVRVNMEEEINEMYEFYQCRRGMYIRKNKKSVCPTLVASAGMGGHNVPLILTKDGIRKLTPEECFKLQGFPIHEGYELPKRWEGKSIGDSHFYKQAGNSVSVPIITCLAEIL